MRVDGDGYGCSSAVEPCRWEVMLQLRAEDCTIRLQLAETWLREYQECATHPACVPTTPAQCHTAPPAALSLGPPAIRAL